MINVSLQYNGGFLPDIILLTLRYYHHRGTRLNAMKRFCLSLQPMIPTKRLDIFSPWLGDAQKVQKMHSDFFFKDNNKELHSENPNTTVST